MKLGYLGLLIAAPLVCLMSAPASATVYIENLGPLYNADLTDFLLPTVHASSNSFDMVFEFNLPYAEQIVVSGVSGTSNAKKADTTAFMTGGLLSLYKGTPLTGVLQDSTAFSLTGKSGNDGTYSSMGLTDTLALGTYYIDVSGTFDPGVSKTTKGKTTFTPDTTAVFGGDGSVDVTASVPELSTWAMMLLGFVGLGFAGYRKTGAVFMKQSEA